MAILVANVGTSDLAFKVGKHYIPMGFDRHEPGVDYTGLTPEQERAWNEREQALVRQFCPKLGVEVTTTAAGKSSFSFRELTLKLLQFYQANMDKWEEKNWRDMFVPIRLLGAIEKAYHHQDFQVREAYIFVTNQNPEHHQDTIHLFEIIKSWLAENFSDLQLNPVVIPNSIKLVDLDALLNYYYIFFKRFNPEDTVLVSIKGGTPQMQSAMKLQAIASGIPRLLFIDPILSLPKVLAGEASDCQLTSYWQYFRQQKYQTVQQLLERWDFAGAINILTQWRTILTFLQDHQVINSQEIGRSGDRLDEVIAGLRCAHSLLDLDVGAAREVMKKTSTLSDSQDFQLNLLIVDDNNYDSLLNLYAQCLIHRELVEIGKFLTTLSSFIEGILYRIIDKIGGYKYLTPNDWLEFNKLKSALGTELYAKLSMQIDRLRGTQLSSRRQLITFITILLKYRQVKNPDRLEIEAWETDEFQLTDGKLVNGMSGLLETLDYWMVQRNKLIHDFEGISSERLEELDRNRPRQACSYQQIVEVMEKLLKNRLLALKNLYKTQFVGTNEYYIYSHIREWAIATLLKETSLE